MVVYNLSTSVSRLYKLYLRLPAYQTLLYDKEIYKFVNCQVCDLGTQRITALYY